MKYQTVCWEVQYNIRVTKGLQWNIKVRNCILDMDMGVWNSIKQCSTFKYFIEENNPKGTCWCLEQLNGDCTS